MYVKRAKRNNLHIFSITRFKLKCKVCLFTYISSFKDIVDTYLSINYVAFVCLLWAVLRQELKQYNKTLLLR